MFPLTDAPGLAHAVPACTRSRSCACSRRTSIAAVRKAIETANPRLATIASESDFGRVDRNLVLITAANVGGSILALFIGATGVMNTSLLSFYERIREFGLLRAVGLEPAAAVRSRARRGADREPDRRRRRHRDRLRRGRRPDARARARRRVPPHVPRRAIFGRALGFAFGMAVLGALYPAVRPRGSHHSSALQHE